MSRCEEASKSAGGAYDRTLVSREFAGRNAAKGSCSGSPKVAELLSLSNVHPHPHFAASLPQRGGAGSGAACGHSRSLHPYLWVAYFHRPFHQRATRHCACCPRRGLARRPSLDQDCVQPAALHCREARWRPARFSAHQRSNPVEGPRRSLARGYSRCGFTGDCMGRPVRRNYAAQGRRLLRGVGRTETGRNRGREEMPGMGRHPNTVPALFQAAFSAPVAACPGL
jgi:hypothetical protein